MATGRLADDQGPGARRDVAMSRPYPAERIAIGFAWLAIGAGLIIFWALVLDALGVI